MSDLKNISPFKILGLIELNLGNGIAKEIRLTIE